MFRNAHRNNVANQQSGWLRDLGQNVKCNCSWLIFSWGLGIGSMALALLCVGLILLCVGLFGVTEFNADFGLRLRGWIMIAAGVALILLGCFAIAQ